MTTKSGALAGLVAPPRLTCSQCVAYESRTVKGRYGKEDRTVYVCLVSKARINPQMAQCSMPDTAKLFVFQAGVLGKKTPKEDTR